MYPEIFFSISHRLLTDEHLEAQSLIHSISALSDIADEHN